LLAFKPTHAGEIAPALHSTLYTVLKFQILRLLLLPFFLDLMRNLLQITGKNSNQLHVPARLEYFSVSKLASCWLPLAQAGFRPSHPSLQPQRLAL
jgi:hypothetical protein